MKPKERIIALRRLGLLQSEIATVLDTKEGNVTYHLKGIQLSEEEEAFLQERLLRSKREGVKKLHTAEVMQRQKNSVQARIAANIKTNPGKRAITSAKIIKNTILIYKPRELPEKHALEKIYSTEFKKEYLDGVVIVNADSKRLISICRSYSSMTSTVKRYAIISSLEDKRQRIVYSFKTDGKNADRLRKLKVEVRPLAELEAQLKQSKNTNTNRKKPK